LFIPISILSAQSNDDCLACHNDNELTMEKDGKEISIYVNEKILSVSAHQKLSCISCHVGFNPDELPHKENIESINCKSCHKDAPVKHPFHPQLKKANGTNGPANISCKGCHGRHDVISPKKVNSKWNGKNITQSWTI
jgi:hypothetical protein